MKESDQTSTKQKLQKAFMKFRKTHWLKRAVEEVKPSEYMVLNCIKRRDEPDSPGLKVSEISERLQVTSPTVTQLINKMEKNGLVERNVDPGDRRAVAVKLTEKGDVLMDQSDAALTEMFEGLIAYLGEEQSQQLAELLMKVHFYFKEN